MVIGAHYILSEIQPEGCLVTRLSDFVEGILLGVQTSQQTTADMQRFLVTATTSAAGTMAAGASPLRGRVPYTMYRSSVQQQPAIPSPSSLYWSCRAREYRGEATESKPPSLSPEEQALLITAKPKADAILAKHVELPKLDRIPIHSLGGETTTKTATTIDEWDIRRKRLLYRSKQRGWLEVDLLLGTWASEHIPSLSEQELEEYEVFVNQETIDIYNIITLRVTELPDQLQNNSVVQRIHTWARSSPLGKADPDTYKEMKQKAKLI